jgi:hypothetical protein
VCEEKTETFDFKWLVKSRSDIQNESLALYDFLCEKRSALDLNKDAASIFGLLLGTTFSLWRAAFLADETRSKRSVLDDAQKFLEFLVRDNAIGYAQDQKAKNWTVGYYLNDARYRLLAINEKLPKLDGVHLPGPIPQIEQLKEMYLSGVELDATTSVWKVEFNILHEAFGVFKAAMEDKS